MRVRTCWAHPLSGCLRASAALRVPRAWRAAVRAGQGNGYRYQHEACDLPAAGQLAQHHRSHQHRRRRHEREQGDGQARTEILGEGGGDEDQRRRDPSRRRTARTTCACTAARAAGRVGFTARHTRIVTCAAAFSGAPSAVSVRPPSPSTCPGGAPGWRSRAAPAGSPHAGRPAS